MHHRPPTPISESGQHLLYAVRAMIVRYERQGAALPVRFKELSPAQAVALLDSLLRLKLRMPAEELLKSDMQERAKRQQDLLRRFRRDP